MPEVIEELKAIERCARSRGTPACDAIAARLAAVLAKLVNRKDADGGMTRPTGEDEMSSEHVEVLWAMLRKCVNERLARKSADREAAALAAAIEALKSAPQPPAEASAPVGVEGLDAAAAEAGYITFESMKQCADAWFAVVDALNAAAPGWNEKKGTGRECATAAIAALAQQPAAVDEAMVERAARAWCAGTDTPFDQLPDTGKARCLEDMRVVLTAALAAQQGGTQE